MSWQYSNMCPELVSNTALAIYSGVLYARFEESWKVSMIVWSTLEADNSLQE